MGDVHILVNGNPDQDDSGKVHQKQFWSNNKMTGSERHWEDDLRHVINRDQESEKNINYLMVNQNQDGLGDPANSLVDVNPD